MSGHGGVVRRTVVGAIAVAGLVAGLVGPVAPAGAAPANPRDTYESSLGQPPRKLSPAGVLGRVWMGTSPLIAGSVTRSAGELIVVDRPFDDTGADTSPDLPTSGTQEVYPGLCDALGGFKHGEYAYPTGAEYGKNAADLVEVRLAAAATDYHVLFQLQTLIDAEKTAVLLGIDADRNAATGSTGWPGYEHVLVVHGSTATLDGNPVTGAADVARNTIEARIPRTALGDGSWRIAAAVALWGASGVEAIVDLGGQAEEIVGTYNCWHDKAQSALIAAGSKFPIDVDVDALRAGASDASDLLRGPMVRLHVPSIDMGEGVTAQPRYAQTSSVQVYRGSVQPYTVYVPNSYNPTADNPLIVLLHCLNCNHNTFHVGAWPGMKQLAETRGAIIVTPLAYGEGGWYEGEAEVDVFDVLADVSARYRIDRSRLYLTGMSMGSLGTYRLGMLHPDLWARALGVGNVTNPTCATVSQKLALGCVTGINYFNILSNARNVPTGVLNGTLDELTPVTGSREIADDLAANGYGYRYWEYSQRRHEPSLHGLAADNIDKWFGNARRVEQPARVTYAVERIMDRDSGLYGIVHDRAYWVRDIRMADGVPRFKVDATSARGQALTTAPFSGSGSDPGGPYTARGLDPTFTAASGANAMTVTTVGATSLTVRVADAGLSTTERLTITVDTDRALSLRVFGFDTTASVAAGRTELILEPGRGVVDQRVLPAGTSVAGGAGSRGSLAATGPDGLGSTPALLAGLTLLALAMFLRRRSPVTGPDQSPKH